MKGFLMTFCCTHKSVSRSALIREAPSCSRWEQMPRPITEQCAESEKPWNTQDVFIKSLPRVQGTLQRAGRKTVRAKGDADTKERRPSGHSRTDHVRIQAVAADTGPTQVYTSWGPSTEREVDTGPTPSPPDAISN